MKKGIIITVIFLVIAVVLTIVFINLFKERDTRDLSNQVVDAVQEGYLNDDAEDTESTYNIINNYLNSVVSSEGITASEVNEIKNVRKLYETYALVADFYSKELVFSDYNDTYKRNKNDAKNGLSKASDKAQEMVNYIQENAEKVGESTNWKARTWIDLRDIAFTFVDANNRAFTSLQVIFEASVTSSLSNNEFSNLVLTAINDNFGKARNEISELANFTDNAYIMANSYLTNDYLRIMGYVYNTDLKEKVKYINENGTENEYYNSLLTGKL